MSSPLYAKKAARRDVGPLIDLKKEKTAHRLLILGECTEYESEFDGSMPLM